MLKMRGNGARARARAAAVRAFMPARALLCWRAIRHYLRYVFARRAICARRARARAYMARDAMHYYEQMSASRFDAFCFCHFSPERARCCLCARAERRYDAMPCCCCCCCLLCYVDMRHAVPNHPSIHPIHSRARACARVMRALLCYAMPYAIYAREKSVVLIEPDH